MSSANSLFIFTMILGPMITFSSSNWIISWVGLELSFLSLIPILFLGKYSSISKEATLKYFCIQAFSSALIFLSGLVIFLDYSSFFELVFLFSLCLKLGLFPGHFWVLSVVSSLDWLSCFILLSWQKVPSFGFLILFLDMNCLEGSQNSLILGGLSALVGGLLGNNTNDIRSMIGSSSIGHSGWAVLGCNNGCFWLYFLLYCLTLMITLFLLSTMNMYSFMGVLSLSGLPPFIMFIGKWSIISSSLWSLTNLKFIIFPIIGTILSLNFYLKFSYSLYLSNKFNNSLNAMLSLMMFNVVGVLYLLL